MDEFAAVFYFIIATVADSPLQPTQIGPLTQVGCAELQANMPKSVPGICKRVVGMKSCNDPDKPWMGYACPVFEGETKSTSGGNNAKKQSKGK
jgi:hypothetical protein